MSDLPPSRREIPADTSPINPLTPSTPEVPTRSDAPVTPGATAARPGDQPSNVPSDAGVEASNAQQRMATDGNAGRPATGMAGSDAFKNSLQSASSRQVGDVTIRTNNGVVEGRQQYDPVSKTMTVQIPGKDGQPQLYQRDDKTHSLIPVDNLGKPTGAAALEYSNMRSGKGSNPETYVGQAPRQTSPEQLQQQKTAAERQAAARTGVPQDGQPKPISPNPGIVSETKVSTGPGKIDSPGGSTPGPRDGFGTGPRDGFGQGKAPGEPGFRPDMGRDRPGHVHPDGTTHGPHRQGPGGDAATPGGPGRMSRAQHEMDNLAAAQRAVDAGDRRWGDRQAGNARADLQDKIGRSLGTGEGRANYHPPDTYRPPHTIPQRDFGAGRPDGPGGRGSGGEGGRGGMNPSGRGEPGAGPARGEAAGGSGYRNTRGFDSDPKGQWGPNGRPGDFLPPGTRPGESHRIDARLAQDLQNPNARRGLLDTIDKFQQGKLELGSKESILLAQILKGIKPDQLGDFKNLLLNQEGKGALRLEPGKFNPETQMSLRNLLGIIQKPGQFNDITEANKNTTARLLDSLGRPERPFDKVPNGEQSRTLLLEMIKGVKDSNLIASTKAPDRLSDLFTRTLGEKPGERGFAPTDKTQFTLKHTDTDSTVRDLTLRLQNKDILTTGREFVLTPAELAGLKQQDNKADARTSNVLQPEMMTGMRQEEISRILASRELAAKAIENTATAKNMPADAPLPSTTPAKFDPAQLATGDKPTNVIEPLKAEDKNIKAQEDEKKRREEAKEKEKEKENQGKRHGLTPEEMAALLQARKLKDLKERELKDKEKSQEKDKKQSQLKDQRVRYRVREKDTLASIAAKQLQDSSLALLIYNLNSTHIPIVKLEDKRYADPKVGSMIWLPSGTDIQKFKGSKPTSDIDFSGIKFSSAEEELASRFGKQWNSESSNEEEGLSAEELEKAKARRENIEKYLGPLKKPEAPVDERLRHTCRLGDNLRSIALKHPFLKDVDLWELLATINGLSTETNAEGNPVSQLSRGAIILIPTQAEIDSFFASKQGGTVSESEAKPEQQEQASNETTVTAPSLESESALLIELPDAEIVHDNIQATRVDQLDEKARIVSTGNLDEIKDGFTMTLEIFSQDKWTKVLSYDCYDNIVLRQELSPEGKKNTMRISLPPAQIIELARNEMNQQWAAFLAKFT